MKQISIGDVLIKDDNIIHDSTKEVFRYPLGAVKCGTKISISLKPFEIEIEKATLCLLKDGMVERIHMAVQSDEDEQDMLRVSFVADGSFRCGAVLWYWFEIELRGGAVCYYGADSPWPSGLGRLYQNPPPAFQITVYDADFETPSWAKEAVLYQIFPDRFSMGDPEKVQAGVEYHKNMGRTETFLHENWNDTPIYEAREGQKYYMPSDIFGGDLEGIRKKLPYIKSLGITLLYLNPIFESASNHRYNTGDYKKIDPILGDEETFQALVKEAEEVGIRIILDGVFSHTGDDSVYFNKYGRYDSTGAYQSMNSPYSGWYCFDEFPDKYTSWWGFETLPEVNEHNQEWIDFVINSQDSVVRHWLKKGMSGYRLDVADELPDETIELIRNAVKEEDSEALLLGEVWEDVTTKQSYGKQRTYALGSGLDTVMNYPFMNRTIEFLKGKIDAWMYSRFLSHQRHTYPAPMYYTLMNLISSHDVCRIRSVLSRDFDLTNMPRSEQANFVLSEEEYILGGKRQRLAAAIQFSLPGIPSVYYGDEVGMTGLLDPFNRLAFREEDVFLVKWYAKLSSLRHSYPVLSTGDVRFFTANGTILAILRYTEDGLDHFGNQVADKKILTLVNPTDETHRFVLDLGEVISAGSAVNLITNSAVSCDKNLIAVDIEPLQAEIFELI